MNTRTTKRNPASPTKRQKAKSMKEEITKAHQSVAIAVQELQAALGNADAVEAILLLDLIERGTGLERRTKQLVNAVAGAGRS